MTAFHSFIHNLLPRGPPQAHIHVSEYVDMKNKFMAGSLVLRSRALIQGCQPLISYFTLVIVEVAEPPLPEVTVTRFGGAIPTKETV